MIVHIVSSSNLAITVRVTIEILASQLIGVEFVLVQPLLNLALELPLAIDD